MTNVLVRLLLKFHVESWYRLQFSSYFCVFACETFMPTMILQYLVRYVELFNTLPGALCGTLLSMYLC